MGQIRARKSRYVVDAIAIIVNNMYKVQKQKKIVRTLLINVKENFDYVFWLKLA